MLVSYYGIPKLIDRIISTGIEDFNEDRKYIKSDLCKKYGVIYESILGVDGDENIGNDPTQSDDFWVDINEESSASLANAILENRQDIEKLRLGVEA